jgi:alkanesulfonate monooxygenase SsuD/methylene tetrahydromethanopterin reductase-like flavin-dependent oxidoreductase (luciferase family)
MGLLPSPEEAATHDFTIEETQFVSETISSHVIGDPLTVRDGLAALQLRTGADELMLSTRTHSFEARLQSFTLLAETWGLEQQ